MDYFLLLLKFHIKTVIFPQKLLSNSEKNIVKDLLPALKGLNLCFNIMNVKLCLLNQEVEEYSFFSNFFP